MFYNFNGCKSTETYTDSIERILIKPEQGMEILLSQLVDTLTFVSLETTLNSLLVQIDKLEYDRGKYFILDRYQHSVLIFDSLGGFINKIGQKGRAPGEFEFLECFTLDTENQYVITTDNFKNLKYFSYEGKYIKSVPLELFYKDLIVTSGGDLAFHTSKMINYEYKKNFLGKITVKKSCFNLHIQTGSEFVKYFSYSDKIFDNGKMYQDISYPFSKYNHFIRYIYPFNDTIFQIIDHKPHPLYYIDFEDKKSKEDLIAMNGEEVEEFYKKNKDCAYFVNNFIETDEFMKIDYFFGNKLYSTIIRKGVNHSIMTGALKNDFFGIDLFFQSVINNEFVSYFSPLLIKKLVEEEPSNEYITFFREHGLLDVNEDNNPIVMKCKFKKNEGIDQ